MNRALVLSFPEVDDVLSSFSAELGRDLPGYRNHVARSLNYFSALEGTGRALPPAVLAAAPFHDIGIWTDKTFDYLEPSVRQAMNHLALRGLDHLAEHVRLLITQHHKVLPYTGPFADTVDRYRRADLVDLSFGWIRHGLPAAFVRSVRTEFPDAGFHRRLAELTAAQTLRSPLRPLPMLRW